MAALKIRQNDHGGAALIMRGEETGDRVRAPGGDGVADGLFGDLLEHRRGHDAALVERARGVEGNKKGKFGIVGKQAGEGGDVVGAGIAARDGLLAVPVLPPTG